MGIGFAIPVNMVKSVVAAARHGGQTVKRPWLGATLQNVSKDIADSIGLDRPIGALVASVAPNSPAARAGVRRGDVIVEIDGKVVDDSGSVGFRLGVKPLGGTASLGLLRDGKKLIAPLELAVAPEVPAREAVRIKTRSPFEGAQAFNLSPAVVEELSLNFASEAAPQGVVIADVAPDTPAANFGVQKGDIVVEVNGVEIKSTRDLAEACAQKARFWDLTISRGGQLIRSRIGG